MNTITDPVLKCGGRCLKIWRLGWLVLEIKKLLVKIYCGLQMDLFAFETAFSVISNELNCLPLCLGSCYDGIMRADLITPSQLLMGQNNHGFLDKDM